MTATTIDGVCSRRKREGCRTAHTHVNNHETTSCCNCMNKLPLPQQEQLHDGTPATTFLRSNHHRNQTTGRLRQRSLVLTMLARVPIDDVEEIGSSAAGFRTLKYRQSSCRFRRLCGGPMMVESISGVESIVGREIAFGVPQSSPAEAG